ncbi:hypothetical protein [Gimesia sp.]|uniref:hypothetical protein n=1 Tax=Gimesia sp. TaxID=2024833 RepID=UPI003A93065E
MSIAEAILSSKNGKPLRILMSQLSYPREQQSGCTKYVNLYLILESRRVNKRQAEERFENDIETPEALINKQP